MATIPSVLAILICDQVIVDQLQKKTLVGVFDRLKSPRVPIAQSLGFFARMTDAEGEYKFTVRIIRLDDAEELVGQLETAQIRCEDRLRTIDLALNIPQAIFPKFGHYEFQLYANDQYVGRAKIEVFKLEG